MAVHRLLFKQQIAAELHTVWDFFSNPANLQVITPPHMRFKVTSGALPDKIYPGQIITYTVAPILGVPLFWMTEIAHVDEGRMFVDTQLRGPYRMWHHQHHFASAAGGVLMTDIVHYELPFWLLGEMVRPLVVTRQLGKIFEYRQQKITSLFPENGKAT